VLASSWLVPQLKQAGYGAIEVGSDACFDLATWRPRGDRAKKVRSAVNLARRLGVTVSPYQLAKSRDLYLEQELQACAEAWLAGRRGFALQFFSAVRPLESAEEKRYFLARHGGRVVGFVSCSPIYARNGWYIEDIVRRPEAVYGTTELLITTALESLREEGFSLATLGISPFANRNPDIEHPARMRVLGAMLAALSPFYNFRGLQHYKKKFAPSWWEPVYVAFWPNRLTWRLVFDVVGALIPGGFLRLVRAWPASYARGLLLQSRAKSKLL
jgi:phosphatidylglycerol lysyltransferase